MKRFSCRALGKNFGVAGAAVMVDHDGASEPVILAAPILGVNEAPAHLECLAGIGLKSSPAIALRPHGELALRKDEIGVFAHVIFRRGRTARVALLLQPVETCRGISDALVEQFVDDSGEAGEGGELMCLTTVAMGLHDKIVPLQLASPCSAEPRSFAELRKVDILRAPAHLRVTLSIIS